ncbi:MAG: hypothetical protein GYA55_14875 [SAR324 cluster bacterium]|uniref:IMP dehydrogenase/GMP reductase domain-containing protein n=1 Tax=SAR324 cluster bacterium TaxID=2024889 RepID=A0A7X9FU96_9DELT|nr:hypothetical protein [SAR324 cluster bacterium]
MRRITIPFATSNKNKIREIEEVLGYSIELVKDLDVPELQCKGFSIEDIIYVASEKAKAAFFANGRKPVIVEDSALSIEALEGRPGPLVDQFAGSIEARQALCRSIGVKGSRATAYCTLAVFDGIEVQTRIGTIDGCIADSPRGSNGFGWDDIFIPKIGNSKSDDSNRTFAEMTAEEKNKISMRKKAVEALRDNPFIIEVSTSSINDYRVVIDKDLLQSFKEFISTPIDPNLKAELEVQYAEYYERLRLNLQRRDRDLLRAAGMYPIHTKYDKLEDGLALLPRDFAVTALVDRHICLEIVTHDALLEAQKTLQTRGYVPVESKNIDVMEKAVAKKRSVTFSDYALGVKQPSEERKYSDSARALIATGLFSYTSNDLVTLPFLMSSMPDVVSAWSLETMALLGGFGFIPVDSIWSNVENQVLMAQEAFSILEKDPAIENHPRRDLLINRAKELIGATLKANPKEAVKRVELLQKSGVKTFRVYDPRNRNVLHETVKALRDRFADNIRIFAGQVVSGSGTEELYEAQRLVEAGANSLIVGIGEGGICSTPTVASLAPDNIKTGYAIAKAGIKAPIVFDGGVGTRVTIAFAVGAAGVLKSRLLIGIEGPGSIWAYNVNGRFARNYSGEAAARTKILGGKIDRRGRPFAVEGVDQLVYIQPEAPSTASIIYDLMQGLATSLIFARAVSVEELQHQRSPLLLYLGARAGNTAQVHHRAL